MDVPFPEANQAAFQDRADYLIRFYADARGNQPVGLIELACRLRLEDWNEESNEQLGQMLDDPHGDMFWMIPTALIFLEAPVAMEARKRIRRLWRSYTPYRGDTENHWLMYYASLYLMSEGDPESGADTWFNGRSASENMAEAREYLSHWAQHTFDEGQTEFDSPHYLSFFVAPLAMLYGYARDPDVKKLADTMLTLMIADFAADQLNGLYVGAFSRVYPEPALERWRNPSTTYAWLLFNNVPLNPDPVNRVLPRIGYRPHGMAAILALSGWSPAPQLQEVAADRSGIKTHLERHRTRRRLRYARSEVPICKMNFMDEDYAVGSTQGGLLQPIQQHTWEVFWKTPHPFDGWNVLFTLHPYSSEHEAGMYFPEEPLLSVAQFAASEKPTYDRADKWTGGSPFERVFQDRNTVIALYDIPPGTRFPFISGYFSRRLSILDDSAGSGWVVAHGDNIMIGYYPLCPFTWQDEPGGDRRLHSTFLRNGAVVHTDRAPNYNGPQDFLKTLGKSAIDVQKSPELQVRFTTPDERELVAQFYRGFSVNGDTVRYDAWPRYDGDFMSTTRAGDVLISPNSSQPLQLRRDSLELS